MFVLSQLLAASPVWLLGCALVFGVIHLAVAYRHWKLSWPGSGYKGITGSYWLMLAVLVIQGGVLLLFAAAGWLTRAAD